MGATIGAPTHPGNRPPVLSRLDRDCDWLTADGTNPYEGLLSYTNGVGRWLSSLDSFIA